MNWTGKCIADIGEPTLFARQNNLKSYNFENGLSRKWDIRKYLHKIQKVMKNVFFSCVTTTGYGHF